MNTAQPLVRALAALGAALLAVTPHAASAVELSTVVSNIHQIGSTGGVSLGHLAIGYTNYNKITVSGTYIASCASAVMAAVNGQRTLTRQDIVGGMGLVTTIPETVPTIVDMPGFDLLTAGTVVACAYNWTSKAVEAGYTLGIPGFGIPIGGGERAEGRTMPFLMAVPASAGDARNGGGCIP
jgi:hypothetical protein